MYLFMADTMQIFCGLAPFRFWYQVMGVFLGFRNKSLANWTYEFLHLIDRPGLKRD